MFFIDRALGLRFADVLAAAGVEVEKHRDHFADNEADEVWIAEVARRGWYALSQDERIYRNPVQREAVIRAGLGYFVLGGANRQFSEVASAFITAYPAVKRFIAATPRPFVASVRLPARPGGAGRVERRYPR